MISRLAWWEYLPVEFCVEELNAYYLVCSLYKVSELCKIIRWTPCRIKLIITEHQHCCKARWYLRITNSITGSTWYIPQITTSRYIPQIIVHTFSHGLIPSYSRTCWHVQCSQYCAQQNSAKLIYTHARANANTRTCTYMHIRCKNEIQLFWNASCN
jgi:hypothetical protein